MKADDRNGLELKEFNVILERRKKNGEVRDKEILHNLIVVDGKERATKLLNGVSTTYFDYIAIGTGTTSPTINDTTLETEYDREQATCSYEADYKAVFEKTFTFTEAKSITEAGIFDGATESGSTMLDRFTFTVKACDAVTDLYIKITVTQG